MWGRSSRDRMLPIAIIHKRNYHAQVNSWTFMQHLRWLQQGLFDRMAPVLRERGLSPGTVWMLGAVTRHPYPSELGRQLGLPAPSVSRLLKGLEADGYVARETVPEDLRRFRIRLTPRGEALVAETQGLLEAFVEEQLGRLRPEERRELDRLLGILAATEGEGNGE